MQARLLPKLQLKNWACNYFLVQIILFSAYSKNNTTNGLISTWVVQRVGLETSDFSDEKNRKGLYLPNTFLNGATFRDSPINPNYPSKSPWYLFTLLQNCFFYLKNSLSRSSYFLPYKFQMAANQ